VDSNKPNLPESLAQSQPSRQRVRRAYSSGGVAYRRHPENGEIEVALIATQGGKRWQLPKGSREADETSIQTAIREVEEEVGLRGEHEAFLQTIEYWYWDTHRKEVPELVHKTVDFFLLRVVGGKLSDASFEVDAVGWFSLQEAQAMLTFSGELEVAKLAQARLTNGDHPG
jgi:8-oxo-dGTP diphosphatase